MLWYAAGRGARTQLELSTKHLRAACSNEESTSSWNIRQYAQKHATMRAFAALSKRDTHGFYFWQEVMMALELKASEVRH
jgi:hypothetical protein